jgi:D-glycero-D-manno-heptose 1,7-bisphosphate phosphatase
MNTSPMKLVILDRDGVINHDSEHFIKSPEEWTPLPGSLAAIAALNQNGWRVAVATNQSGLARGLFDMQALNAMHAKMHKALAAVGGRIDAVFFCPHLPEDECDCRKPKPGLLIRIAERFGVPMAEVPMVGDAYRDLEAGVAAGCPTFLVKTGKGAATLARGDLPKGTMVFDDLAATVAHLVAQPAKKKRG